MKKPLTALKSKRIKYALSTHVNADISAINNNFHKHASIRDDTHLSRLKDESTYNEKVRAEIALNSISDAVICTNIDCNIDYLNIAAEKLLAGSVKKPMASPLTKCLILSTAPHANLHLILLD